MPTRIQLRRVKGWRKPAGAVCVTRPGPWGNPFGVDRWEWKMPDVPLWSAVRAASRKVVRHVETRADAVALAVRAFRLYARLRLCREPGWLDPIRGKDLCCHCPAGSPCHADVLLELANR